MTDTATTRSGAHETLWTGDGYSAFVAASVTDESFTVKFIKQDNTEAYTYVITKKRYQNRTYASSAPSSVPTDLPTFTPTEEPLVSSTSEIVHKTLWDVLISESRRHYVVLSSIVLITGAAGAVLWRYQRQRGASIHSLHDLLPEDSCSSSIGTPRSISGLAGSGLAKTTSSLSPFTTSFDEEQGRGAESRK